MSSDQSQNDGKGKSGDEVFETTCCCKECVEQWKNEEEAKKLRKMLFTKKYYDYLIDLCRLASLPEDKSILLKMAIQIQLKLNYDPPKTFDDLKEKSSEYKQKLWYFHSICLPEHRKFVENLIVNTIDRTKK